MNKVCFITGASTHNGRTMALKIAEAGYDLAIHHSGRDKEGAETLKEAVEAMGRRAEIFEEDFTKDGAAARVFTKFREKFDRLDLFVNNAGITRLKLIPDFSEEDFAPLLNVDLKAAMFCIKEACEFMREKKIEGSVIVIASNHHDRIWRGGAFYGSVKEALCRYVKYAAVEYGRDKIRVNALAPGYIYWEQEEAQKNVKIDEICEREIPLHRFVTSSELAAWALFISGPAAKSLTGQVIDIDGGASLLNDSMDRYGY